MDDNSLNIDQSILQFYLNTVYKVFQPLLELVIGQENPLLNEFLIDNNCYSWAFVSCYKPGLNPLTIPENDLLYQKLLEIMDFHNWRYCDGLSISKLGDRPPQKQLFILDIELEDAIQLGRKFEQNAILFGELGGEVELIWC